MAPPIPLDHLSGAALTITHEEHDIHEGNSFTFHFQSSAPLPTAAGEETAVGFTTPTAEQSRKLIHMTVNALADDESTFEIRESPTVVVDKGFTGTPINRLRTLPINTSELRDQETAAAADSLTTYNVAQANLASLSGGIILHSETLAVGGNPPFASVQNTNPMSERQWVLNPGTDYVIILTNLTINDTVHHITLNWSEDPPANYVS